MSAQGRRTTNWWIDKFGIAITCFFAVMAITKLDEQGKDIADIKADVSSVKTAVQYTNARVDYLFDHR